MMSDADTILTIGHVLTAPGRLPPLGPSAIRIRGGRIAAIDPIPAETVGPDAAGLLAMPAPTNAHDHGRGLRTIAYGAADDRLESWLQALALDPSTDVYVNTAVAFARMAEGGICAANHCHAPQDAARLFEEAVAVSRAAEDVGIRVAFAVPFMNRNRGVYGDVANLLALLEPDDRTASAGAGNPSPIADHLDMVERIAGLEHAFFRVQYGPVGPQWVSDDALIALARASEATGRRIHMHMFETRRQREWADSVYEGGMVAFLDRIGFLSPRLTLAHGVWFDAQECALLAERGVSVAVNHSSNLRLRSGLPPLTAFRDAGLKFGVGLDASSLDDDEDMLREIRLLWRMGRGFGETDGLTPAEVFDAALVNGRQTVLDEPGGLEVGAPADIMVLDLAAMSEDCIDPDFDIADLLLTRMSKRHLNRLVVAGRTVVERGKCITVDRPALEQVLHAEARASRLSSHPDRGRIVRLQRAVDAFYKAGAHRTAPARSV